MTWFHVPSGVRKEALKGLSWRGQYRRGGTKVGVHTARLLLSGRVTEAKVRHIARYFPRHAWERKMWWRDGEPSNGRIAWALWGGDAGRRWAAGILRRLVCKGDRLRG